MRKMFRKRAFKSIKGVTLVEVMLVLAISALLILAGIIFYVATKTNASASKVVTDMNGIVAAADTYVSGGQPVANLVSPASTTDNNSVTVGAIAPLQKAGLLPNPLTDPWGGSYSATVVGGTASTATITITIPGASSGDSNCNSIASAVTGGEGVTAITGGVCTFQYPL